MNKNNYWSATTSILLSDKMQSTIGGPEPIIDALSLKLQMAGIVINNKHFISNNCSNASFATVNAARFTDDPGSLLDAMSLHTVKLHAHENSHYFSNYMISLDIGADASVVGHIEQVLENNGIQFSKENAFIEDNHIDFSYELTHILELK